MSITAMKQALEALQDNRRPHYYCEDTWYSCPKHEDGCANEAEADECNCGADKANEQIDLAITVLRQAIEQAEKQEPVAWIKPDKENSGFLITLYEENGWTPLYTAPPSKPWVDLTNDEAAECWTTSAIMTWKRIQDKLREKNT